METANMSVSGPMFWGKGSKEECVRSVHGKDGGHYNTYAAKPGFGMRVLKDVFPGGEANDLNFVLFSTSGVHGTYTTIEQIEGGLKRYGSGDDIDDNEAWPDDWHGRELTFLIVQPRLVTMTYGEVEVSLADIPYLKKLRETSWRAMVKIGGSDDS